MKQIPLTQGKFALVDDDMFDYLSQWKWQAQKMGKGYYYATRSERFEKPNGKYSYKKISMHRVIAGASDAKFLVDHINHITLDNRKENIRICTFAENCKNRSSAKNSSSNYLGVSLRRKSNRWQSHIWINGRSKHLGYFDSEIQAALKYNAAAIIHHGQFANLNVIPESNSFTPQNATT
jgi:hypothetical protein